MKLFDPDLIQSNGLNTGTYCGKPSISAIGKNSAIPHYKLTKKTNLSFKKNVIYLVDSGAQYYDGTTDILSTKLLVGSD